MDKELLIRKLDREIKARKQAESILETKALELFNANQELNALNAQLERQVLKRTSELKESETRYRSLVENASDIIFNVDEDGYFTYINSIGANSFGYSVDEILGKRYVDFVVESHREELFSYYTRLKEDKTKTDYMEFPVYDKNGRLVWIGQNVNLIEDIDDGIYYSAVARDISKRKEAEEKLTLVQKALTKSEIKYRSILENMDLGLMEVDTEGKITRVYDHFNDMTGYQGEELIGLDALDTFVVEGFRDTIVNQDKSRLKGQSGVYEIKIRKKDGSEIWVLISGAPFYNVEGEVIGSIGIHYDITERKNLEKELKRAQAEAIKAQQAEKDFLASMSHEIRTPLNAIIGMSHLLNDTSLDNQQKEYLEILSGSASILQNLISDILDISKIDAGTLEPQLSEVDLADLCERLVHTLRSKNRDRPVSIDLNFSSLLSHTVVTDGQWLNQILLNLLSNAEKFTEEGRIDLNIDVVEENKDSCHIFFSVTDTGIGLSSEEQKFIFQKFKQADPSIRRMYGGTGLGLTISKNLVGLLGGELIVASEKGKGSKFSFSLELKKGSLRKSVKKKSGKISDLLTEAKKKHILIVEDNLMNQKYISSLLSKWDVNYTICNNGLEAIEAADREKYDLIFMDLSMPVMDGYTACRKIQEGMGLNAETIIIALTASTFLSKKQLALEAGMKDFISKPFTPDQLSFYLKKYLSNKSYDIAHATFVFDNALDVSALKELYGDDIEYASEMFDMFLSVIVDEMKIIENICESDNLIAVHKQAHKMKPTFKMVGLTELFSLMEELEKSTDIQQVIKGITQLRSKLSEKLPILKIESDRMKSELLKINQ